MLRVVTQIGHSVGIEVEATAGGILEHRTEMTLSCLWALICRAELFDQKGKNTDHARRQRFIEWYRSATSDLTARPEVHDLTKCWQSGHALCALIASANPRLLGWAAVPSADEAALGLALRLLHSHFGVPMLRTHDFLCSRGPDEQCVMLYLHVVRKAMAGREPSGPMEFRPLFLPGSPKWRAVFGAHPRVPLRPNVGGLSQSRRCIGLGWCPSLSALAGVAESLGEVHHSGDGWFEATLDALNISDAKRYERILTSFASPRETVDVKAVFCMLVLCSSDAYEDKLALAIAQYADATTGDVTLVAAAEFWSMVNGVGEFVLSELGRQMQQLCGFDEDPGASHDREAYRLKVAKLCNVNCRTETMTAQMFAEFGGNIPTEVFCQWCAIKPQVRTWFEWLGCLCRQAIMRMSADDPQACCADDSCKSLGDIESLSVGVGRQLFLSDFETMLPQLGVTDSDSISRLFKLLDQDGTGQVNEPFARTAFSLLAVDDAAEKIRFAFQSATQEQPRSSDLAPGNALSVLLQSWLLVAREVVNCSITNAADLLCAETQDIKAVLLETCTRLDVHVSAIIDSVATMPSHTVMQTLQSNGSCSQWVKAVAVLWKENTDTMGVPDGDEASEAVAHSGAKVEAALSSRRRPVSPNDHHLSRPPYSSTPPPCDGVLSVTLHRLVGLVLVPNADMLDGFGRPDPYAVLKIQGQRGARPQKSSTKVQTTQPVFEDRFEFFIQAGSDLVSLSVQVWSSVDCGSDQFLGSAQINVCRLYSDRWLAENAQPVCVDIPLGDPDTKVKLPTASGLKGGHVYGTAAVTVHFQPKTEAETSDSASDDMLELPSAPPPVVAPDGAPAPPDPTTRDLPKYLTWITNEDARVFWHDYIGDKRAATEDVLDLIEAWLVKADIGFDECDSVVETLRGAFSNQSHLSYSDFNKLTKTMTPFTPATVCETIQSSPFWRTFAAAQPQDPPATPSPSASPPTSGQHAARKESLRQELQLMKTTQLRKRAIAESIDSDVLDDALDSDTPKEALVEVLLRHLLAAESKRVYRRNELREEMQAMKTTALRKKAIAEGVDSDTLDDALDSDSPKDALVEVLVQHSLVSAEVVRPADTPEKTNDQDTRDESAETTPDDAVQLTAEVPAFLDLISNEGARQFWAHYVVEMRVSSHQLLDALDAWLLLGGVSERDRAACVGLAGGQLGGSGHVSYGEFNKFTLEMTPWIPARVCEVILKDNQGSGAVKSQPELALPTIASGGPRWLELIINPGAREFWHDYISEKRCATNDVTDALEAWIMGGCNISRHELGILMQTVCNRLDADKNGFVSYGEFNGFTLEMMPFTPERVREILSRSTGERFGGEETQTWSDGTTSAVQEAEDGPAQQGTRKPAEEPAEPDAELAPGVSNGGVLLATELREAAPEGDTLVLDDLDDLDGLDDDLETPPLPPPPELPQAVAASAQEQEPAKDDDAPGLTAGDLFPRSATHIVAGSQWWRRSVNNATVERRSQVHRPVIVVDWAVLETQVLGLRESSTRAQVLKLLRDLKIKDRSAQLIADTYINKSDKADALQVAGSLAFLCQRSPVEIPEMVFKMFATGDLLKMSGYQRWVGSISKMAKVCATGSHPIFNALCGGDCEPSKEKKQAEFNFVLMNAAKTHVQSMESQLLVRFKSNVANAAGMKRKKFCSWLLSMQASQRWMLGLSEEWRNMVDSGAALAVPPTTLPLSLRQLKTHFESPSRERRISQVRMTECLGKMGVDSKTTMQRITHVYDLDYTSRYVLRRDVLTGLSLLCNESTGDLIQFAMQSHEVEMDKAGISARRVYAALRAYTATAIEVGLALMGNCSLFEGDRKTQDTLSRIVNIRVSMYINSVAHRIEEFVKKMATSQLDYSDLGRMLDQKCGLQKWRGTVGKLLAAELQLLKYESDSPRSASTLQVASASTARNLNSGGPDDGAAAYTAADIRCVQPGSFWNRVLVFSGGLMPRQNKRAPSAFDTLNSSHAHEILSHNITQDLLDEMLHSLDIKSHSVSEDLYHLMTTFSHDKSLCLACAVVLLCKLDIKNKFAVTYELLTNTKPGGHETSRRAVWHDIEIWMESMVHVSEEVVTHVTHRLHDICSGERKERSKQDQDDSLLQKVLASMKVFTDASVDELKKECAREIEKLTSASAVVQSQRLGRGDGLNQKEFVRWMAGRKGVRRPIESWLSTVGSVWVVQLCEFEECSKDGIAKPTSVQRLRAAGLDKRWSKLNPEVIHSALGITTDKLIEDEETGIVVPRPDWLRSDAAVIHSADLCRVLGELGFAQVSAERVSLLMDTNGLGRSHLREILALLYLISGHSSEERVDRILLMFELGKNPNVRMPETIFHFLMPYMVLALDAAEGMATMISDLYGKEYTAKQSMLEYAHDHVCEYADHVGTSLASFIRQRGTKNFATPAVIRLFLDESLGFSQWVTDVANEWVIHCDMFSAMKAGAVLREELQKYMDYKNQFETVAPESLWWKSVVQNVDYHAAFAGSHADWDGVQDDARIAQARFDVEQLWRMQSDSVDSYVSTAEAQEIVQSSGIVQLPAVAGVLHKVFDAGGREAKVGWSEFCVGCMFIGDAPLTSKLQRAVQFLAGRNASVPVAAVVDAIGKTLAMISMFNTANLNDTLQRLCGHRHEPEWVSKHEQFQTMTFRATEKAMAVKTASLFSDLLESAQGGAVPVTDIVAWAQSDAPFQHILKTAVVWLQHSLLVKCTPDPHVATATEVDLKLRQMNVDRLKPIIAKYIARGRAGPKFMMEMAKAAEINSEMRDQLSLLLVDSSDGTIDVREGGVVFSMMCGATDARGKFDFAAELYDLPKLQESTDRTRLSFTMGSYSKRTMIALSPR